MVAPEMEVSSAINGLTQRIARAIAADDLGTDDAGTWELKGATEQFLVVHARLLETSILQRISRLSDKYETTSIYSAFPAPNSSPSAFVEEYIGEETELIRNHSRLRDIANSELQHRE